MSYELVLGLEIHIQPKLESGMFCRCSAKGFGDEPNTHTCPVCLGLPGALPIPNKKAVELTQLLGLALNCELNEHSKFDRKNYFYPDLPKGYQISQYDEPLCSGGHLTLHSNKKVALTRIHLEEDTGKSIHVGGKTLLDFNKSGFALIEIVTEPELHSSEDAVDLCKMLQRIVRYLDISDGDLEKGQMRFEANISLRPEGKTELPNYKVEVKNINSFRFLEKAINYEVTRQSKLLDAGETPKQENRGWDDIKQVTLSQREKEEAHDYRYFPEPDIPPMVFTQSYFAKLKTQLIELPFAKEQRYIKDFGLSLESASILTESRELADIFEALAKNFEPKKVANLLVNKPELRTLSLKELEQLLLEQTTKTTLSDSETSPIIHEVISANPKAVLDYKNGKEQALAFLLGEAMKLAKGKLDAPSAKKALIESINGAI